MSETISDLPDGSAPLPSTSVRVVRCVRCFVTLRAAVSSSPPPSLLRRYDYVEVYNGGDEASTMVGKFCGKIAPSPIISSGGQLLIKFVSDYETHGAGFSVRYEVFKTGAWPLTPG